MAIVDQVGGWLAVALGAGGGGKFLYDIITARAKSHEAGAKGQAVLLNSAGDYAKQLTEDLRRMRADFDAFRDKQAALAARQEARFRLHARWDEDVRRRLAELGEVVAIAPPLYADPLPEE